MFLISFIILLFAINLAVLLAEKRGNSIRDGKFWVLLFFMVVLVGITLYSHA